MQLFLLLPFLVCGAASDTILLSEYDDGQPEVPTSFIPATTPIATFTTAAFTTAEATSSITTSNGVSSNLAELVLNPLQSFIFEIISEADITSQSVIASPVLASETLSIHTTSKIKPSLPPDCQAMMEIHGGWQAGECV